MSLPLIENALPVKSAFVCPPFARWSAPGDVDGMTDRLTLATTSFVDPSGPHPKARKYPEFARSALFATAKTRYVYPLSPLNVFVDGAQRLFQFATTSLLKLSTPMPAERFATWSACWIADSATK